MRQGWLLAVCVALLLVTGSAKGDWPSARHDPQRTGVSVNTSDLTNPSVYWKSYVGGHIDPTGFLAGDINKDGTIDFIYVDGGTIVAKRADGTVLWRTPPRDYAALFAIDDFDGDGLPDLIASGPNRAYVLAAKDGSVEWAESSLDLGTLGSIRVADFNGDGRPDVLVEECHCCAVANGSTGYIYTFARTGATLVATQFGELPPMVGDFYSCGVPTVVFDGNGDGQVEIAHAGSTRMYVLGGDGQFLVDENHSPAVGASLYRSDCLPADVDGVPGQELVCFDAHIDATSPGPRQVFVLHYDTTTTPSSVELLWQNTSISDATGGNLDFPPNAVVDLDGNGTKEVIASGFKGGQWSTYVFDGKTGTTLGSIPNARAVGTAPIRSDGNVQLLTSDGQNLTAWLYNPIPPIVLTVTWTEANRTPVLRVDPVLLRQLRANQALVLPDLNVDGVPDLLTVTVAEGSAFFGYSGATGVPSALATFSFDPGVDPIGTWLVPPTTRAYPQVVTTASDGSLFLLDNQLQPTSPTPIHVGGFCSGGTSSSPAIASLTGQGGTQSVFATDSRGALQRFDAQNASLANPPKAQWARRHCTSPTIVPGLDEGRPGVVCSGVQTPLTSPPLPALSAIRGDGSLVWNAPLPDRIINDELPGSADASNIPSVFVQTVDQENRITTWSFSGATGMPVWSTPPALISWGVHPFSVADWDGDGILDVVSVLDTFQALSGASGQTLINASQFLAYGIPILKDVNNDGVLDATLTNAYYPARTLQHDLVTPLWVGGNTEPYPAGAIANCATAPQLVEGSSLSPSRLYFTNASGSAAGVSTSIVLAGGAIYPDEATATAAGAYLGQLSDLAIGSNLTGTGHPTAVVGSSDGWLYGVNACSGALDFALQMGSSVCGAVFGDTDGDGRDEIIASTSDGYISDIQNTEIASPAPVIDIDPPNGVTDREVTQIATQSTLFGAWTAVPGATGYEVAVAHEPDGIISTPPWQSVGNVTSAAVNGLPLVVGQRYMFVVRAVGLLGHSVDASSPGVTVIAVAGPSAPPTCEADGGALLGSPPSTTATSLPDGSPADAGALPEPLSNTDGASPTDASAVETDSACADQHGSGRQPEEGGGCSAVPSPGGPPLPIAAVFLALLYRRRRPRSEA